MSGPRRKTEVATIKPTPEAKRAWEAVAEYVRSSLVNVFEIAIVGYVKLHHLAVHKGEVALAASDLVSR